MSGELAETKRMCARGVSSSDGDAMRRCIAGYTIADFPGFVWWRDLWWLLADRGGDVPILWVNGMKLRGVVREARNNSSLVVLASIAGLAFACLAWQLIGLRYTNHDDIYFHLCSKIFSGDYIGYAKIAAQKQARLQAYINMPVVLWVYGFANSELFDLLNIGMFGLVYVGLGWVLACIGGIRNSLAILAVTLLLFPIHYYFTFPQGYPVMADWGMAFALLSAGMLDSCLRRPSAYKLLASATLFTFSLWGPEYNFILHPALLLVVFISYGRLNAKFVLKNIWPHLIGWVGSGLIYLMYSVVSRESGADMYGRVSIGFDALAMTKTFLLLQKKALLPLALWDGVRLVSASAQGGPQIPSPLTYLSLWSGTRDALSVGVVFVLAFSVAAMVLYRQRLTARQVRLCMIFFLLIGLIPCFVLSASSHYQLIVLKGYLQGHLASFYSQLGFSGILFVFLAYLCNVSSGRAFAHAATFVSSVMLASAVTVTFVYNNVNRQVMAANRQKWMAMDELVDYIQSDRPDLMEGVIAVPDFWSFSGVSNIPGGNMPDGNNYWTSYARNVLGSLIEFGRSEGQARNGFVEAKYFANPSGSPITLLIEGLNKDSLGVTLVASRPVDGMIYYKYGDGLIKDVSLDRWSCVDVCIMHLAVPEALLVDSFVFRPDHQGPVNLIAQFLLARDKGFAFPVANLGRSHASAGR